MSSLKWLFLFIYEVLTSIVFSLVGYHRNKESYEKKEKIFEPFRKIMSNFSLNLKGKPYEKYKPKIHKTFTNRLTTLVILVLLIVLARFSLVEPYKIPTGSLIPTLKIGDHLFVNKLAYGFRLPWLGELKAWGEPKRGEIVTFYPPTSYDKMYVKRLAGQPGDHIRVEDTKLFINGTEIIKEELPFMPEMENTGDANSPIPYTTDYYTLYEEDLLGVKHFALQIKNRDWLPRKFSVDLTVPEGYFFFMGDNRDNSEDSRVWGLVPRDRIRGRVALIWLSLNWSKIFKSDFIRWDRFFISPK